MAIFVSLKYFGKECDNNCDAWITCHNYIKGFIKIILPLSIAMVITTTKCKFFKMYQNLVTMSSFSIFLPNLLLPCKDTFMDDYNGI
jgi:hypothetical protein